MKFREYLNEGFEKKRNFSNKKAQQYWKFMNGEKDFHNDFIMVLRSIADSSGTDTAKDFLQEIKDVLNTIKLKDFDTGEK